MTRFVALLRGVNVGGNTRVNMKELAAMASELGYTDVSTYLNSGNLLFSATETDPLAHAANLEKAIEKTFGFPVRVMVKSKADLERVRDANPFAHETIESDRTLFVQFLFDRLEDTDMDAFRQLASESEQYEPRTNEVYVLLVRADFPKTHMSKNTLKNKLKKDSTVRNWNTLTNLIDRL